MKDIFADKLLKIKHEGLYRQIPEMENGCGKMIEIDGKKYLNLGSNNYLGFSTRKELIEASVLAVEKYGASSGASRIVTGNYSIFDELEKELALFKGTDRSIVLNSGFTANLAIMTCLADKSTCVFSDKLNHASIIDGISMSKAKHVRYRHNDMENLKSLLEKHKDIPKKIIVTDTIFSMDGDKADLAGIVKLAKDYKALTVVDEAHATGVFGAGLAHNMGLEKEINIHMGTFSKALGSFGGYVAGDSVMIDYITNAARSFIFTTSLPPAVIGANLAAVRLLKEGFSGGKKLLENSVFLREILSSMGFDTAESETQIIPVILRDNQKTLDAKKFLLENGVFVGAIRPPTVPLGTSRLRISLRSDIEKNELESLTSLFKQLKEQILI